MRKNNNNQRRPKIVISKTDFERLTKLATALADRNPRASDDLFAELDRARIVSDGWMREDIVQIGSTVQYRTATGDTRTVTLVYPGEADIGEGKISVLTPIGTALLGLSVGQSMTWATRDGRELELSVVSVRQTRHDRERPSSSDLPHATVAGA